MATEKHAPTLWLPIYAAAQQFLRIMDGCSFLQYKTMLDDITAQAGSKQAPVDWSDPDSWIPTRLKDHPESRELAARLWGNPAGSSIRAGLLRFGNLYMLKILRMYRIIWQSPRNAANDLCLVMNRQYWRLTRTKCCFSC